jgi:hypothetical protein
MISPDVLQNAVSFQLSAISFLVSRLTAETLTADAS